MLGSSEARHRLCEQLSKQGAVLGQFIAILGLYNVFVQN